MPEATSCSRLGLRSSLTAPGTLRVRLAGDFFVGGFESWPEGVLCMAFLLVLDIGDNTMTGTDLESKSPVAFLPEDSSTQKSFRC